MNMKNKIGIQYLESIVLTPGNETNSKLAASISAQMIKYGFMPTSNLLEALEGQTIATLVSLYDELSDVMAEIKGADVEYIPMYPNFPSQVMEASDAELYITAILHYWTGGEWKPEYTVADRPVIAEDVKYRSIDVASESQFKEVFTKILKSNDSISGTDKNTVEWFLDNVTDLTFPTEIPFKENMCYFAGLLIQRGMDVAQVATTATDVLRIATVLSGGDVSLAENTKFKSLSRKNRRSLVQALDRVIREEDIARHAGKWVRLFHNLHVGEYSTHVFEIAKKFRNNEKISTFNGRVQQAINDGNVKQAVAMLVTRPGDFARRLSHVMRLDTKQELSVIESFSTVVDKVPTRTLYQMLGHFKSRTSDVFERVAFPKGNVQHAMLIKEPLSALAGPTLDKVNTVITNSLINRFSELETLGNVYIDPALMNCPLPTQQRSAAEAARTVARGTHLPIGNDSTLRLFIYWIGRDIDLSAGLYDENFNNCGFVNFSDMRSESNGIYHSGDIVNAPDGASEFIDVDIERAVSNGTRYIMMDVRVYTGPSFGEHESCYAGWMTRDNPNSNEVYMPDTVQQKIDLTSSSKACAPVIFDLVNRTAIWADLHSRTMQSNSTIREGAASNKQILESILGTEHKSSLYDLFAMHAVARGNLTDNREEADTVFGTYDGDVTPYDITTINADYMV